MSFLFITGYLTGLDLFRRPRVEGCRPPGEADVRSGQVLEFNVTQMISDQLM